jgi:hypothetical protein
LVANERSSTLAMEIDEQNARQDDLMKMQIQVNVTT